MSARFRRGSGVYTCRTCGHRTRATGRGDNEHVDLCADCYDLGGLENQVADGTPLSADQSTEVRALAAFVNDRAGREVWPLKNFKML